MSHHVCLVSEQAAPNITPALDPAVRPEAVTLVVAPEMKRRARWLARVLREGAGVRVRHWPVADAWNVEHLIGRFLELLETGDALILNATGGTKPMSIAAFEAFHAYDRPVFYVHLKELLGGLHGRGMLVSYLPLALPDRRRAADLGIRVCEGRQIQDLPFCNSWTDVACDIVLAASCFVHRHRPYGLQPPMSTGVTSRGTPGRAIEDGQPILQLMEIFCLICPSLLISRRAVFNPTSSTNGS